MEPEKPHYVLVCQNVDCLARGAGKLIELLQARLAGRAGCEVRPYMCFGACQDGPNVVLYPERVWYAGVKESDVEDIARHVEGGPPVTRLEEGIDPSLKALIFDLLDAGLF
ncbi:MAG TPA: (2Fe-2S) ferredoxin domain-containing protein [Chloroflexota bacterium]|jgi:(2Fe-2S) ferredoxin|nr:(2Fe-2S) ferredoxin domain-containing protein [Chloroflexota bacterium]